MQSPKMQQKHHQSSKGAALSKAVLTKSEDFFVSEYHKLAYHVMRSSVIENFMSLVILVNFCMIIIETDELARSDTTPGWLDISGWIVLIVFVLELAGRLYVERRSFFDDHFNIFDCSIVVVDASFSLLAVAFGSLFPVSILRIFRLCKVARVSKVLRVFPELRLMMAGMIGAMSAILWGAMLLSLGILVWAIVAVQFIHPLNHDLAEQGVYSDECERCGKAFQDVMSATLTFCQQIVAGDSWGQVTIPIIEHHPTTAIFFVSVYLTVGMAILNLMLAVCVDVATQARQSLKVEMQEEKLLTQEALSSQLIAICREMDTDNSGELSKEELVNGYDASEDFQRTLQELDIGREDLEIVWIILDSDKSGLVSYTEFIAQLLGMKNSDSQFMLAYIKYYITVIKDNLSDQMVELAKVNEEEKSIEKRIEGKIDHEIGLIEDAKSKMDATAARLGAQGIPDDLLISSASPMQGLTPPRAVLSMDVPVQPNYGQPAQPNVIREEKMAARDVSSLDRLIQESRAQQSELMAAMKLISDQLSMGHTSAEQKGARISSENDSSSFWPGYCQSACIGTARRDRLMVPSAPPMPRPALLTVPRT